MTQRKRVLVTGAAGFVGSWLCRRLVDDDHEVTGLVRRHPVDDGLFARLGLSSRVAIHCLDEGPLADRIATAAPDMIVNLAGQSQVLAGTDDPRGTFAANTAFVWELLDAVRTSGLKPAVIHASTDSVYGDMQARLAREDDWAAVAGPYPTSKAAAELVARCFAATYDLPVVIIRFGNIYGPGDPNVSRLIPDVLRKLSAGMPPRLRDGTAVRSYLHVDDAVTAILLLAARASEPTVKGEVFNVAGDVGHSTLDVVSLARAACGRQDIEPVVWNDLSSEISIKLSSIDKIARTVGWRPTVSLSEGLKRLLNHQEIQP